ncbi:hypothetical protein OROHE_012809 [Orobanche hederae]
MAGFNDIIRDEDGEVLAETKTLRVHGDSTLCEGMSLQFALRTTFDSDIENLITEVDSENSINTLKEVEMVRSYISVDCIKYSCT